MNYFPCLGEKFRCLWWMHGSWMLTFLQNTASDGSGILKYSYIASHQLPLLLWVSVSVIPLHVSHVVWLSCVLSLDYFCIPTRSVCVLLKFLPKMTCWLFSQLVWSVWGNGSTQGPLIMTLILLITMIPTSLLPPHHCPCQTWECFGTALQFTLACFDLCQERLLLDLAELASHTWPLTVSLSCFLFACSPPSLRSCCCLAHPVKEINSAWLPGTQH